MRPRWRLWLLPAPAAASPQHPPSVVHHPSPLPTTRLLSTTVPTGLSSLQEFQAMQLNTTKLNQHQIPDVRSDNSVADMHPPKLLII
jgi:hypothetical protein